MSRRRGDATDWVQGVAEALCPSISVEPYTNLRNEPLAILTII